MTPQVRITTYTATSNFSSRYVIVDHSKLEVVIDRGQSGLLWFHNSDDSHLSSACFGLESTIGCGNHSTRILVGEPHALVLIQKIKESSQETANFTGSPIIRQQSILALNWSLPHKKLQFEVVSIANSSSSVVAGQVVGTDNGLVYPRVLVSKVALWLISLGLQ